MNKLFLVILLFGLQISSLKAQPGGKWVSLEGKVLSISMRTPLEATLTLESLPYGGDNRVFSSDKADGTFGFKVKQGSEYKLKVSSEGYLTVQQTITIKKTLSPLLIELVPSGENTLLRLNINFDEGKAKVVKESFPELDKLVNMMIEYPAMEIQLEGHTDFRGSSTANFRLSEERVIAVKDYLVAKNIDTKRISTKAFGGTEPLTKENTALAKLTNRRVEARILKIQ